jgi:hypothetical protein
MAMSIQNPAKCEVRAVIRFLHAKEETTAEIHRQLVSVYGEDVMIRQNVAKWCHEFEVGRSDVHDEITSGKSSIVTDEIIQRIDENIRTDRCLTIDELHQQCPEVLRTVPHEREQAGDFYNAGIKKKLVSRLTKCIAIHGDYAEK